MVWFQSCTSTSLCFLLTFDFICVILPEKAVAPHSSTLAWKVPWTEEPGRLQSMGSRRVGHDWVTSLSLFTSMHWRRKRQPTPVFLPGESQGQRSLVGCHLWGHSRTRLKRFSSSSSSSSICPWLKELGTNSLMFTQPALLKYLSDFKRLELLAEKPLIKDSTKQVKQKPKKRTVVLNTVRNYYP